jgi:hypothetical protein
MSQENVDLVRRVFDEIAPIHAVGLQFGLQSRRRRQAHRCRARRQREAALVADELVVPLFRR